MSARAHELASRSRSASEIFIEARATLSDREYREFALATFKHAALELLSELELSPDDLRELLEEIEEQL